MCGRERGGVRGEICMEGRGGGGGEERDMYGRERYGGGDGGRGEGGGRLELMALNEN